MTPARIGCHSCVRHIHGATIWGKVAMALPARVSMLGLVLLIAACGAPLPEGAVTRRPTWAMLMGSGGEAFDGREVTVSGICVEWSSGGDSTRHLLFETDSHAALARETGPVDPADTPTGAIEVFGVGGAAPGAETADRCSGATTLTGVFYRYVRYGELHLRTSSQDPEEATVEHDSAADGSG